MPSFADTGRSGAPQEELWKLLSEPSRLGEWWASDFAEPPLVAPVREGQRVVISCAASGSRFEWRLEPDGPGTRIDVLVDVPEDEVFRLDQQRDLVRRSLVRLAEAATVARL
jgi:hypothetical protein